MSRTSAVLAGYMSSCLGTDSPRHPVTSQEIRPLLQQRAALVEKIAQGVSLFSEAAQRVRKNCRTHSPPRIGALHAPHDGPPVGNVDAE